MTEVRTLVVPQRSPSDSLLTNCLKQRATKLLRLVNQKCQHHQHREVRRQILRAITKVVPELIALILERVERFVFDLPTRATASDKMTCVVRSDSQIGDPTEAFESRVVRPAKCGGAPCGFGLSHFAEKMFVIVGLGAQDETHVESLQQADVRCVTC
jgi:hypothetical protein